MELAIEKFHMMPNEFLQKYPLYEIREVQGWYLMKHQDELEREIAEKNKKGRKKKNLTLGSAPSPSPAPASE